MNYLKKLTVTIIITLISINGNAQLLGVSYNTVLGGNTIEKRGVTNDGVPYLVDEINDEFYTEFVYYFDRNRNVKATKVFTEGKGGFFKMKSILLSKEYIYDKKQHAWVNKDLKIIVTTYSYSETPGTYVFEFKSF